MMIIVKPTPALYIALQNRLDAMGKGDYAKEAMRKAIRETAKETKERIYSATKETYTIKTSSFKKSDIKVTSPTKNQLSATLKVESGPLSLRKSYQNRKNGKRKGASAMIKVGGSMKELSIVSGGHNYKAFVTEMQSGHEGIFQRVPGEYMKKYPRTRGRKGREKIQEILSMSRAKAAEIAYKEKVASDMQGELSYRLHKHMNAMMGG